MMSLAALFVLAAPLRADIPAKTDSGSFTISRSGLAVGVEKFTYSVTGDSIVISSRATQMVPRLRGADTLSKDVTADTMFKEMTMVASVYDYDLRFYQSQQRYRGQNLLRGLQLADTVFNSYMQVNGIGEGSTLVRPPGKMYILDPQLFVLYDVICRNLYKQSFESRPIWLFALGLPDSMIQATAADLGRETIQWGENPVEARKLRISDAEMEFYMWVAPNGRMLRLEQPEFGMRVERIPEPIKPRKQPRRGG
jgi:hypothetical protein